MVQIRWRQSECPEDILLIHCANLSGEVTAEVGNVIISSCLYNINNIYITKETLVFLQNRPLRAPP